MNDKNNLQNIINELKQQYPESKIKIHDNQILSVNDVRIGVTTLEIIEPQEKDDEKPGINELKILFKTKDGYIIIAEVNKDGEILFDGEALEKAKLSDSIRIDEDENDIGLFKNEQGEIKKDNEEKGEEEKGDEEKPELEQEKDEKKPELNHKKGSWIKLDKSSKVTENSTLQDLIPNSEKYQEIYIVPGKDHHSYTIQGGDKENGYEIIEGLEQTEGNNPTQKMISIQSKGEMEVESKQALVMFKIKGREDEGFSISKAQSGNDQVRMEYWRKAYNDMYISSTVAQETADRGTDMPSPEVRYLMSKNYTSRLEMEEIFETHKDLEELKKQDVPDEIDPTTDGIELEELDREIFKQKMYEKVLKMLNDQNQGYPDNRGNIATKIVNSVVDDGMEYERAKDEALGINRDNSEDRENEELHTHDHKLY